MKIPLLILSSILVLLPVGWELTAQEESCGGAACHGSLFKLSELHPPFEDDCTNCHELKAEEAKHPENPGQEYTIGDEVPTLCYNCHDEKGTKQNIHSPVEEGDCTTCHSPHGSNSEYFLL